MTKRSFLGHASTLLLLASVWAGGSAGYISLKANIAQYLLERAWHASQSEASAVRPWPWADTWPVARLSFERLGQNLIVLQGASGRNLAFGPAHVTRSPWPEAGGNTLIAGHRDTHFKLLDRVRAGDRINLSRSGQLHRYRIADMGVVHQDAAAELEGLAGNNLLLVTCYPFAAIDPGTPWRYVVRAVRDDS